MIELLIVITIIGIVMAMALPKMAPLRAGAGVRSAKQVVHAYLATARQAAVRRGGTAQLVVSGNTVSVTSVVNGVTTQVAAPVNLSEQYGVTVVSDVASIAYTSRGLARLAGPGKLSFTRDASKDSVCITILGMVGKCGL
ncbi:MAG: type II secretion system protein [Gemmatimonadaceae bacterium]|nr:type II secretion system protein [Gemmatimonadaceae bacterium]